LRRAQASLSAVEPLIRRRMPRAAEKAARRSLAQFASAMNWLEDTEYANTTHQLLDSAGHYVRVTFGCELTFSKGRYRQTCPVALAHIRIGFSPETYIEGFDCTVCGEDVAQCPHVSGREYDGVICRQRPRGFRFLASAMVNRPEQPDARITSMTVDVPGLPATIFGERQGHASVSCNRCLEPCSGLIEPDLGKMREDGGEAASDANSDSGMELTVALMFATD
jgi:hypothetical protein